MMPTLMNVINYLLPFFAFILMIFGLVRNKISFILTALIISIISIFIQYESAGGELFGPYFDFTHAAIYTLSFIVLITGLMHIMLTEKIFKSKKIRYPVTFIFILIMLASIIIVINVWINAYFVNNKSTHTDIIEVGYFTNTEYCNNPIVYYKLNPKRQVAFLCPNHYYLFAKRGTLNKVPKLLLEKIIKVKAVNTPPKTIENKLTSE